MSTNQFQPYSNSEPRRSGGRTVAVIALVLAVIIAVAALGSVGFARATGKLFHVVSESNTPTLQIDDRIYGKKLSSNAELKRGELVVLDSPKAVIDQNPAATTIIKRVVALSGDAVESRDGKLYVNGKEADEPYLAADTETTDVQPLTVPSGQVYVLGDNRSNSSDSRYFGSIPRDSVKYHVTRIVYPFDRFEKLPD